MHKLVILNKMGLSEKLLRKVLYTRKSVLGVRLMLPIIIMSMLTLESHARHNRSNTEVTKIIKIHEENAQLYHGFKVEIIDENLE